MFRSRVRALGALLAVGLVGALMAPAHAAGTQNIFHAWNVNLTAATECEPNSYDSAAGDVATARGATYVVTQCMGNINGENWPVGGVVAKVDGSGGLVWSKQILTGGDAITAGDFGVVVAEWANVGARLTRFGPGGAKIWQVELPHTINDIAVVNGQLFAGGNGRNSSGPAYVARLDLGTGAVQAEKNYTDGGGEVVGMTEFRGTLVLAVQTSTSTGPVSLVRRIGPGLKVWWTEKSSHAWIYDIDASDDQIFTTGEATPVRSGGLEVLTPNGVKVRFKKFDDTRLVVATPGGAVTISQEFVTSYNLDGTKRWQLRTMSDPVSVRGADWNYHGIRVLANKQRVGFILLKITKNDACPC